jgi:urease beta subunit
MKIIRCSLISLVISALAFLNSGCGIIGKRYEKKETVEFRMNTSGRKNLTLYNVTGNIKITKTDSSGELIIKAEKTAKVRKRDLDKPIQDLRVTIDTSSENIIVTGERSKLNGFSFSFSSSRTAIDFDIKVPSDIKLDVSNTNGKVDLNNAGNNIEVSVVNGSITFDNISGNSTLDVTNGKIDGSVDSSSGMRLHITNGTASVNFSPNYKGLVQGEVVNGKIFRDGLNFSNVTEDKKNFKGWLSNGGSELHIEVINGKIQLTGR